jgi:hypothetical protein
MNTEGQRTLDYATPTAPKPRRIWLPILCLLVAFNVWNWPRLTPTFFPNMFDVIALILLAPAAFVVARISSLPGWVFTLFGGLSVLLFLMANFNDNNFRRNTTLNDVLLPWCVMVVGGAVAARFIASAGRGGRITR